jgi:hypothetical protein
MLTAGKHLTDKQRRIIEPSERCFTPFNMTMRFDGCIAIIAGRAGVLPARDARDASTVTQSDITVFAVSAATAPTP